MFKRMGASEWENKSSKILWKAPEYRHNLNLCTNKRSRPRKKEEFYEQLSKISEKVPRQDILIVMSDINAKVGRNNVGRQNVMGKEGLGGRNENGDLFLDFCAQNELWLAGCFSNTRIFTNIPGLCQMVTLKIKLTILLWRTNIEEVSWMLEPWQEPISTATMSWW